MADEPDRTSLALTTSSTRTASTNQPTPHEQQRPSSFSFLQAQSRPSSTATSKSNFTDQDRLSVYTERSIHSLPEGEEDRTESGSFRGKKVGRTEGNEQTGEIDNRFKRGDAGEGISSIGFPLGREKDVEASSRTSTARADEAGSGKPGKSSLGGYDQVGRQSQAGCQQQRIMTAYPRFRVNSMNAVESLSVGETAGSRGNDVGRTTSGFGFGSGSKLPPGSEIENTPEAGIGSAVVLSQPAKQTSTRPPPPGRMRIRLKSNDPALHPRPSPRWGNNPTCSSSSGRSTPLIPSSPVKVGSGEMVWSPPGSPRKVRVRWGSTFGVGGGGGAGLPSEEEGERLEERRGKAWRTVREMGESEGRFRSGLNVVIDLFLDPLTRLAGTDAEVISVRQIKQIFGNIREIEALSERMEEALNKVIRSADSDQEGQGDMDRRDGAQVKRLGEIKRGHGTLTRSSSAPALFQKARIRGRGGEDLVPRISNVLLGFLPYLSLYYPFITAFPTIPSTLNELYANNAKFTAFVRMQEEQVRCQHLGLCHWLLTVVQRIPRWTILIENLCKVMDDPGEREALGRAHAMSEKVTENINERLKEQTAVLTLVNLQKAFDGLSRPLVAPARKLIKKGLLRQHGGYPSQVWLFLFNDILVCAKAAGGTSVTSNMLSQWIYTAEGSLSAFASSMAQVISHSSSQTRQKGSRPTSVVENFFTCTAWIEVEDMTIFALEGERDAARRERAFQITSPLTSMELLAEDHSEKESWLMALTDAKYGRLADLQTIQQTATIRQAKRKSLHAVSRRSSSSAFSTAQDPNYMSIDDLVMAVEADGYNSPVVQSRSSGACGQCRAVFTLIKAPHPCLLACGKLFCSDCLVQTFTITGDPNGKLRAACDRCYRSVFRSPAPTEHDVLDAHVNFTLSRHSLDQDQRQRQNSVGNAADLSALTNTPATSRTSSRSIGEGGPGDKGDTEPSQAIKKLRELLQR